MSHESATRIEAMRALFDQSLEDLDPATLSPLYVELRSLQERYVEPELLAVGGMKRILKVLDRQSNRHVAMARLHKDASDLLFDPFIREGRLTALLEHPNVISVYDVGVDDEGQPFFTMELKVGDGLGVVLKKAHAGNGPALRERLEIFLKACDAISYAHSRNVIHLDIKPSNVQVGHFGEVLVCDWGLGKLLGTSDEIADEDLLNPDLLGEMNLPSQVKGTPGYMAPEQVNGEARDARTDVYALGALLYAVLTCQPPMTGDTKSMLRSTVAGDLVPPAERDPDVPESLSAVVMKAMALNPDARYQSVNALANDVRAFIGGYSPAAHDSGLATAIVLFYRRQRALCNLAAASIAVVLLVTAIFVERLGAKRAQAEELAATLQVEKQESEALLREVGVLATPFLADVNDESMLRNGGQISNDFFFQAPLASYKLSVHSLNEVIRDQPDKRDQARGQLGYLYFIATDFAKAKPFLAADPKRLEGLANVNDELIASFDKEAHRSSARELARTIDLVLVRLNRRNLVDKLLAYDHAALGYRADYELAVAAIYRRYGGTLSYDTSTATGILTGRDLKSLKSNSKLSPLRFLPIKHLKLVETSVLDAADLEALPTLKTADLRGSRISQLPDLGALPKLETLIVRPGQLSPEVLTEAAALIRIDERAP